MHLLKHTTRKPKSIITIDDPEFNQQIQMETKCCCHCRQHWVLKPGSGVTRGYCFKCGDVTCGRKACGTCVPYEKKQGW